MSSSLLWEPVRHADKTLSTDLKFLLREVYAFPVDVTFTAQHLQELTALKAGRSEALRQEIEMLIAAVEEYEAIRVFEGNW